MSKIVTEQSSAYLNRKYPSHPAEVFEMAESLVTLAKKATVMNKFLHGDV